MADSLFLYSFHLFCVRSLCQAEALVFDAVNDMSVKLAEKIFPKAVKVNIYEATTYGDIPTQAELLP